MLCFKYLVILSTLLRDMGKDMRRFKITNPSGTLTEWAINSVWSRDTGGERDENGAPIRALDGIWKALFDEAQEHARMSCAIVEKLDQDADGFLNYRERISNPLH